MPRCRVVTYGSGADDASRNLLEAAIHKGLSARASDRILKVARTIADLAGEENLQTLLLKQFSIAPSTECSDEREDEQRIQGCPTRAIPPDDTTNRKTDFYTRTIHWLCDG